MFLKFTIVEENVRPRAASWELRAWVDEYEEHMGGVLDCTRYPLPSRTGDPIILKLIPGALF